MLNDKLCKEAIIMSTITISKVDEYIDKLQAADNTTKVEIENKLVSIGDEVVEDLVNYLQVLKGTVRGVVAMTLIRIGEPAVDYLKKAAKENKDFGWIADYLITEINAA